MDFSHLLDNLMVLGSEGFFAEPNPWFVLPFVLLLGSIATAPFINKPWWEHNYPKVSFGLGGLVVLYYIFGLHHGDRVVETLLEYISFICLIGSLFVVSGGIHITVKGEAKPIVNVAFLLIGAVIANIIGTTGASMLLIRPWVRMNKYRITSFHTVFFIFIISNCGGALTPVGDPPLFLGYLKGVPFWWVVENCWQGWLLTIGMLLAFFFFLDGMNFRKAPKAVRERETAHEEWRFDGLNNLYFLAIILGAVFINHPMFLRELLMVGAALLSYLKTPKQVHESNHFDFGPIKEVAILFTGIFGTMMPALDYLQVHARTLGVTSPLAFYWGSGALSSVLDNAPTYLTFISASIGLFVDGEIVKQIHHLISTHGTDLATLTGPHAIEIKNTFLALQKYHGGALKDGQVSLDAIQICYLMGNHPAYIKAVSLGSVFFGAVTYIGNGPNFMVKAIAEQQGAHTPHFAEYFYRYSLPILVLILAITGAVLFGEFSL